MCMVTKMVTLPSADFGEGRRRLAAARTQEGQDLADARAVRAAEETTAFGQGGRPTRRSPLSSPRPTRGGRRMRRARHTRKSALRGANLLKPQSQNHPTSQSHANLPPKPSAPNGRRKLPSPSKPCGFADGLATGKNQEQEDDRNM